MCLCCYCHLSACISARLPALHPPTPPATCSHTFDVYETIHTTCRFICIDFLVLSVVWCMITITMITMMQVEVGVVIRTRPGQRVLLVGSHPTLGGWDLSKAWKLKWSDGHIWRGCLELPADIRALEFKVGAAERGGWGMQGLLAPTSAKCCVMNTPSQARISPYHTHTDITHTDKPPTTPRPPPLLPCCASGCAQVCRSHHLGAWQ